jgi:hypothetical protein
MKGFKKRAAAAFMMAIAAGASGANAQDANNVLDLSEINGPVVFDTVDDSERILLDMDSQGHVVNAMFNALQSIDVPNNILAAYQNDDGSIILRNQMVTFEDGNGSAYLSSGTTIENMQTHIIGASVQIDELENGNCRVDLMVNHSGSFEQGVIDERRVIIDYEVDCENGSIISRAGHAVAHDDATNQWTISAAQTIEYHFTNALGPAAQDSIAQFRPASAATSVDLPPISADLNSLSRILGDSGTAVKSDFKLQK